MLMFERPTEQFAGQLLLRDAFEAIEIDQDVEVRRLDVEIGKRTAEGLLHQLAGPGDGDPAAKTRMIPGKGLIFVHRCTLLFSVEHYWIPTMANFALKVTRLGFLAAAGVSPLLAGKAAFRSVLPNALRKTAR
jgi:hypothetical protein